MAEISRKKRGRGEHLDEDAGKLWGCFEDQLRIETGSDGIDGESEESSEDTEGSDDEYDDNIDGLVEADPEEVQRFAAMDAKEEMVVDSGGPRPSVRQEIWVENLFRSWRRVRGYSTTKSIGDLSEDSDLRGFADMLKRFILEVRKKKDQGLFPPTSVQNMLRAINRLVKARAALRTVQSGIKLPDVDIFSDPRYLKVKLAGNVAVTRAFKKGIGQSAKKPDILTVDQEILMRNFPGNQPDHPWGANRLFAWYCSLYFFVRAAAEMRKVCLSDFSIHTGRHGRYLRFTQGLSKNWKADVKRCAAHQMRPPVDCCVPDVLATWDILVSNRPMWVKEEPEPMFLQEVRNWRSGSGKWWYTSAAGKNKISKYTWDLCSKVPELKHLFITNKTGRATAITRLGEAHCPSNIARSLTGHHSDQAYNQYILSDKGIRSRAMHRLISSERIGDRLATYAEVYADEVRRHEGSVEEDIRRISATAKAKGRASVEDIIEEKVWSNETFVEELEAKLKKAEAEASKLRAETELKASRISSTTVGGHNFSDLTNCHISINYVVDPRFLPCFPGMGASGGPVIRELEKGEPSSNALL